MYLHYIQIIVPENQINTNQLVESEAAAYTFRTAARWHTDSILPARWGRGSLMQMF